VGGWHLGVCVLDRVQISSSEFVAKHKAKSIPHAVPCTNIGMFGAVMRESGTTILMAL
jgi:hypothetical protein